MVKYAYLSDGMKSGAFHVDGSGFIYRGSLKYAKSSNGTLTLVGAETPSGLLTPDGSCFSVRDHLGSVVYEIDEMSYGFTDGALYGEWGAREALYGVNPTPVSRRHYTGKEDQWPDFAVPYTDFGARHYSPALRRWLAPDLLSEKYYTSSPYAYCAGDPVNFVDPDGKDRVVIVKGNTIHVYASYYVPNVKYEGVSAFNAFSKAADYLNKSKGLKYIQDGKAYNVRFHIDVVNKTRPEKEAINVEGANFVEVDSSIGYRKDKNGNNELGGSSGGKRVIIHNKHIRQIGVVLHEMLHSMGAALKPGPNGEDPHEQTGLMTKTDSNQTMVITQKTIDDIIQYKNGIIE